MEQPTNREAIILFDGVCNFCNASVNFIIDNDANGYFKFASLQSPEAKRYLKGCLPEVAGGAGEDILSSVILYEGGQCYRQSTAALRIARKLNGGWPLFYALIVIPASIRDVVYDWIARNRYRWFGKRESCRLPSPELRTRFLDNLNSSSA